MKIGIELKIDVTKIDKSRIHVGKKGKYITLTSFVDLENEDKFGNAGFVTHAKQKGEEGRLPILGNTRIFYKDEEADQKTGSVGGGQQLPGDDVPF